MVSDVVQEHVPYFLLTPELRISPCRPGRYDDTELWLLIGQKLMIIYYYLILAALTEV